MLLQPKPKVTKVSSTKAKRHTHKYHKVMVSGVKLWACALPDCNHYMPHHMAALVPGKNSYCWSCGSVMQLDSDNMKLDRPICELCAHPELANAMAVIDDVDLK